MTVIVDHGIPVVSSRQWVWGLSPNAGGTGWNYIAASYNYPSANPVEWAVIKNVTGTPTVPSEQLYNTTSKHYPNSLYNPSSSRGQIRAPNGRIYWPLFLNTFACYDPTTEQVTEFGPFVESPPINPNQSTIPYSTCFDHAGKLYFSTQESANRPSCVVSIDTTTNAITVLGYVGSGALAGTTYGYYTVADTITAKKFIYVAYGQDPWQLWALDITPGPTFGVSTKLAEVPATGNISFVQIVGTGWTAVLNNGDGTFTTLWCLDGAAYAYTPGQPPPPGAPAARDVSPATNPLVVPPGISAPGIDVVGWRPNGSTGAYTYVNYSVNFFLPIQIESLVNTNDGILGNSQQYNGFFQYYEPADTHTWFGPASGLVSGGPRLNVSGTVYFAGYPNGALYSYNPDAAWITPGNPLSLGSYSVNGSLSGMKYADYLAWAPLAGVAGRLYCAGSRERNGLGSGIGSWDKSTLLFAGTFAATGMDTCLPTGLCVLGGISRVVMATRLITPPGTANLYVFDYAFNLIATLPVIGGLSNLGQIFETRTPNIIAGIVQGSGNSLGIWKYNVATQTFISYTELPVVGVIGAMCQQPGGTVWLMSGNNIVRVDLTSVTASVFADATTIATVVQMSFAADGHTLFLAGGLNSGVTGAQVFSTDVGTILSAGTLTGVGAIKDASLVAAGAAILSAGPLTGVGIVNPAALHRNVDIDPDTGSNVIVQFNDEASTVTLGQPLYSDGENTFRLAAADGSTRSTLIGVVAQAAILSGDFGNIAVAGIVIGTTAQWDAICGTVGGLTFNTVYYLHPTIAGRLTSVAPSSSGQEVVRVIKALSPTQAEICITSPILL